MKEVWKHIEGQQGYKVSNTGRVSSNRKSACKSLYKILSPRVTTKGYLEVRLGDRRMYKVHRLVAQAFIPNPENKPQVNHKNGVKTNNSVMNLEWSTPKENMRHSVKTGLYRCLSGETHPHARVTFNQADEIRRIYSMGSIKQTEIADMYGIHQTSVSRIIREERYVRSAK